MCVNFTDLNPRLEARKYPMRDCLSIVQRLHESTLFSGIDMKAGFLNVPVGSETADLLGVITQDGLYRYLRMAFGLLEAPMYF
jgi:hypothetical protein